MIDSLLANIERFRAPTCWSEFGLEARQYLVLTSHRPANVDDIRRLKSMLFAIGGGCRGLPAIVPVHPRTAKMLRGSHVLQINLRLVEPQPYLKFNFLVKHAKAELPIPVASRRRQQ